MATCINHIIFEIVITMVMNSKITRERNTFVALKMRIPIHEIPSLGTCPSFHSCMRKTYFFLIYSYS